jgi:hypothetical protein
MRAIGYQPGLLGWELQVTAAVLTFPFNILSNSHFLASKLQFTLTKRWSAASFMLLILL